MSEQATGEATPVILTPRLVFDSSAEADIPQFLRQKAGKVREPGDVVEPDTPVEVVDPVASVAMEDPLEDEDIDPSETIEPVEAPAETNAPVMAENMIDEASDTPDLDQLTVEELQRHQEEIDRRIRQKQEAEKKAVIEQIVNVVNTYKIPIDELIEALGGLKVKRKGVKAKPKYQDPVTGTLWSGRGKEPSWIKGKDRKPFMIK